MKSAIRRTRRASFAILTLLARLGLRACEVVSLELALPQATYPLKLRALVRYRRGLHYGFEFLALSMEQRAAIRRVCEMLAAEA